MDTHQKTDWNIKKRQFGHNPSLTNGPIILLDKRTTFKLKLSLQPANAHRLLLTHLLHLLNNKSVIRFYPQSTILRKRFAPLLIIRRLNHNTVDGSKEYL